MEAEFHALVEALRVASIASDSRECCEAYTDAEPLRTKLCGTRPEREDWGEYYDSAHWLFEKFDSWELEYTSRSNNERAHELAREALFDGRENLK